MTSPVFFKQTWTSDVLVCGFSGTGAYWYAGIAVFDMKYQLGESQPNRYVIGWKLIIV